MPSGIGIENSLDIFWAPRGWLGQGLPDFVFVYLHFGMAPCGAGGFGCGGVWDEGTGELTCGAQHFRSAEGGGGARLVRKWHMGWAIITLGGSFIVVRGWWVECSLAVWLSERGPAFQ